MKRKVTYLSVACIITVTALACIQGYFIYNTYLLRAKEANSVITQRLLDIETSGKLQAVNTVWMRKTRDFMVDYHQGKASSEEYVRLINEISDSLSRAVNNYISKKGHFQDYDVTYSNYVVQVLLLKKDGGKDTLFNGKMLLYGNNTEGNPETKASQNTWQGNASDDEFGSQTVADIDYQVVSERYYSISDWQQHILMQMSGLLIFSVLLLVFVVLLFYISIKSLIRQRKIADIKTDFINNITHEFQTPLAALDIAVKTLQRKEGELSPEHYTNTLQIIDRQNKRMQKLFSQVTQASLLPEADAMQSLKFEDVTEIINDFRLSHPETVIHCTQEHEGIVLKMDKFHLSTVLVNLLDNAVKYGAAHIDILLEAGLKDTIIKVKDNGPGIPAKEHALLFEKFYRVQKGNIHTTKGLGLGLFYVKRITDAYKGTVTINSEEGRGAEFTISIPL